MRSKAFEITFLAGLITLMVGLMSTILYVAVTDEDKLFRWTISSKLYINKNDISPYDMKIDARSIEVFSSEARMDNIQLDRSVVLTGNITEIGTSVGNRPFIGMQIGGVKGIGCFFDNYYTDYLYGNFETGLPISIRCTYKGVVFGNLVFSDCSIIRE